MLAGVKPMVPFMSDHASVVVPFEDAYTDFAPGDLLMCCPELPGSVLSILNLEAFNSFTEQFPEKISFGEFTQGLFELKALLPSISGDILKDLSSLYLTEKFGWENLVSDLKALNNLLRDVQARLAWLRKTYGKPTKLGYYKGNCYDPGNDGRTHESMWADARWGTRFTRLSYRCDYRAGCWLVQKLQHLNDAIGLFRGFVTALGLANPVKSIWEVLPFSFVVDWFFNISTQLDRLTRVRPAEAWDLYGLGYSLSYSATVRVDQFSRGWYDPDITSDQTVQLGTAKIQIYDRSAGLPIGAESLIPSNLSPSQLVLLAAMLGANSP
jgi:hypothetical protein